MYMIFRQLCSKTNFRKKTYLKKTQNNLKIKESVSSLFKPVPVKEDSNDANVGAELTGVLNKRKIVQILCDFATKEVIKELSIKYGLDGNFY